MIYVPSSGPRPARYMLVGEAPGGDEELKGLPFVGQAGKMLDYLLGAAGISRNECFITNVAHFRPPANKIELWLTDKKAKAERQGLNLQTNGLYHNEYVRDGVQELLADIETVQPEVIVAFGNTPLWALTGQTGITKWAGSELWYGDRIRLIPTLHPASLGIGRNPAGKPLVVHDLKNRVAAKMENPEDGREPHWRFDIGTRLDNIIRVLRTLKKNLDSFRHPLSVDVETKHGRLDCAGIAWSRRDAICVPFIDTSNHRVFTEDEEREVVSYLKPVLTHPNAIIIGQNFNYDAQFFINDPSFGFRVICAHDTKVAQHTMFPGTDKDLVTLSRTYCDWHCYWKDDLKDSAKSLDDIKRWRYNARDCCVTYEVYEKQLPVLQRLGFIRV